MSEEMTLISFDLCPYVQRARMIMNEKNIAHKVKYIDLSNKPDWFLKLSPTGKVPILSVGSEVIFESAVICEYLNEISGEGLHPSDPFTKAVHRSWVEFGSSILGKIAQLYNAKVKDEFDRIRDGIEKDFLRVLENVNGPYFAGNQFYIVDAVYATVFRYFDVFEKQYGIKILASGLDDLTWFGSLMGRESVKKAVVDDYYERLDKFLQSKDTYISSLRK